jgi:hypothetical protein
MLQREMGACIDGVVAGLGAGSFEYDMYFLAKKSGLLYS